ncbi:methyltransferase type 11 [Caballeronia hypogeia]|uniref:Methyltransferase type 11 n=1 Tax=Caballeronia hypogeia TaxID=1777140 RepID=A0A158CX14_9BURK|nr:class I SAM-dependent methyltransferase [Caballeronia hypogeia]SAK86849.1 methyltransferase type 11 [Caballeronia hypogeia]
MNEIRNPDQQFAGSIPELYDTHMVPLIFEAYAQDIARRVASLRPERVLEVAAGTGVVTRALAKLVGESATIVSTDLNPAMLARAQSVGTARPVHWQQADATHLPFADAQFDVVVCQFGVMFFPEKAKAFEEIKRVLSPRGVFIFNVWDRIEDNAFAHVVTNALASVFLTDPPTFMKRIAHGYHDLRLIERDLRSGGFGGQILLETMSLVSRSDTPNIAAIAYCQGTPLRLEIEAHGSDALPRATKASTAALTDRFGSGPIEGTIQAHVCVASPR